MYGLALGGEKGVEQVLRSILADLELTMGLSGFRNLGEREMKSLQRLIGRTWYVRCKREVWIRYCCRYCCTTIGMRPGVCKCPVEYGGIEYRSPGLGRPMHKASGLVPV